MADVAVHRGARRQPRALAGITRLDADALRRVTYGLLLAFWFTLPWEALVRLGDTATLARGLGAAVALSAVMAVVVGGWRTRLGEVLPLMVAFAGVVTASMIWSASARSTEQRIGTIVQLVVMVAITWEFAQGRSRVRGLMTTWVAGCVFLGLVIGIPFLLGSDNIRFSAPGTSPGDNAYSLLIAVPIAWYLSLQPDTRPWLVWAYRLFVPFACGSVILTASRAGLITMALALLVVPLTLPWLSPRGRLGLGLGVVTLIGISGPLAAAAASPLARLSTTGAELTSGTLDKRTTLWKIGFDLMAQHPLLGLGAGGSKSAVNAQLADDKGLHNTFLSVAVELGLVGLVVFLLLVVAATYRALFSLPPLEARMAWVLVPLILVSLMTLHAEYEKSTYALLTMVALIGLHWSRRTPPATEAIAARA